MTCSCTQWTQNIEHIERQYDSASLLERMMVDARATRPNLTDGKSLKLTSIASHEVLLFDIGQGSVAQ